VLNFGDDIFDYIHGFSVVLVRLTTKWFSHCQLQEAEFLLKPDGYSGQEIRRLSWKRKVLYRIPESRWSLSSTS
jgi:hypothetical protein